VQGEYWEKCRNATEEWFGRIPDPEQLDLRRRFQSSDDSQHIAAYWEIYLHEFLLRCGYSVQAHPLHGQGVKSPDFLATSAGEAFYLEATTIELPKPERDENGRRQAIFDAILRKVHSENFTIGIESVVDGASSPPTNSLCRELNEWLESLDPGACVPTHGGRLEFPERRISFADWVWSFTALPRLSPGRYWSIIQMYPSQGGVVTDHSDIAQKLKEKAERYGNLEHPLLLAIMSPRVHAGDIGDVHRALFGISGDMPVRLCEGSWHGEYIGSQSGLWVNQNGPTRTNVTGVLYLSHLGCHAVAQRRITAWECPWSGHRLPTQLIADRITLNCFDNSFDLIQAMKAPHEVFGLPVDWPNCDPWPDP
jgi:hypothetical protein